MLEGNKIEVDYGKKKEAMDSKNLKARLTEVLDRAPTEEEMLVCLKLSPAELAKIGENMGDLS